MLALYFFGVIIGHGISIGNRTQAAYDAAKALALGQSDFCFLLIYGGTGNGKSHLANAVTIALNLQGRDCRLYDVADLLSHLRECVGDNTIEAEVKLLKEMYALVLDDFKPEYATAWGADRIEEIINFRYRASLITMLTTNIDVTQIPDRIVSRFNDPEMSKAVFNQGVDYRMRRK